MRDPELALEQGELMPGYLLAGESEQGRHGALGGADTATSQPSAEPCPLATLYVRPSTLTCGTCLATRVTARLPRKTNAVATMVWSGLEMNNTSITGIRSAGSACRAESATCPLTC
jgi:hypothetical protein